MNTLRHKIHFPTESYCGQSEVLKGGKKKGKALIYLIWWIQMLEKECTPILTLVLYFK
jgi:hypothetical protein